MTAKLEEILEEIKTRTSDFCRSHDLDHRVVSVQLWHSHGSGGHWHQIDLTVDPLERAEAALRHVTEPEKERLFRFKYYGTVDIRARSTLEARREVESNALVPYRFDLVEVEDD